MTDDDLIKLAKKMGCNDQSIELIKMVSWMDENGGATAFTALIDMMISKRLCLRTHEIVERIFDDGKMDDQTISRIVEVPVNLITDKRNKWEAHNGK